MLTPCVSDYSAVIVLFQVLFVLGVWCFLNELPIYLICSLLYFFALLTMNCVLLGFSDSKFCQQVSHRRLHPAAVLGHSGVHGAQQPWPLPEGGARDHYWPTHSPSSRVSKSDSTTVGRENASGGQPPKPPGNGFILVWLIYRKRILIRYIIKPCPMLVPHHTDMAQLLAPGCSPCLLLSLVCPQCLGRHSVLINVGRYR